MQSSKAELRIPTAELQTLLGSQSALNPQTTSYRRSAVQRDWPCGCTVTYAFDRFEDARWTPCDGHARDTIG
jgi:hypothetical protein